MLCHCLSLFALAMRPPPFDLCTYRKQQNIVRCISSVPWYSCSSNGGARWYLVYIFIVLLKMIDMASNPRRCVSIMHVVLIKEINAGRLVSIACCICMRVILATFTLCFSSMYRCMSMAAMSCFLFELCAYAYERMMHVRFVHSKI